MCLRIDQVKRFIKKIFLNEAPSLTFIVSTVTETDSVLLQLANKVPSIRSINHNLFTVVKIINSR